VSVGAAILPFIAPLIAEGVKFRTKPLNILVCENLAHAPFILRSYVSGHLTNSSILNQVGFVGATIGRMVPVMPLQQRMDDPTLIAVESFCTLPIDGEALVQPIPELKHTILCSPFAFEEGKKLYIHNMGHALVAYFGFLQNFEFIWQAIGETSINEKVRNAMAATAEALARKYNEDRSRLSSYVDDLLTRFGNKGLGDTVARVGRDPLRKLSPGDRLMGAIDLCREQCTGYSSILSGIAAALRFDMPDDPSSGLLREQLDTHGAAGFLRESCGLSEADAARVMTL